MILSGRALSAWGVGALAVVLFLALNVLSQNLFRTARVDLTEGGLYTLSSCIDSLLTLKNTYW